MPPEILPPHAIDAERAVLGSMLIEKDAVIKALDILTDNDFYSTNHKHIFRAITVLYMNNEPAETVTVSNALRMKNLLEDVGGAQYLLDMIGQVSTAANVEHYAQIVKDKAVLRTIVAVSTDMAVDAGSQGKTPQEILGKAESSIYALSAATTTKGFSPVSDLVHPMLEAIEKLHNDKRDYPGLVTGFDEFDKMTAGLQNGDLILIAGRPSMGKTAFGLNITTNVAIKRSAPVALFSLEMSKESLMIRMAASVGGVNAHQARQGWIAGHNWVKFTEAVAKIHSAPIYIDDTATLNVVEIRTRSRKLASELRGKGTPLSLIVIDYLQMMHGVGRSESREREMAEISRSLKGLARDLNIPVIALSQLSRQTEQKGREGHKPQMSDLRESGALEQDADVIAFMYRESYYKRDDPELERKATLILAKQRNGPTGEIPLSFIREWTRFDNYKDMYEEEVTS